MTKLTQSQKLANLLTLKKVVKRAEIAKRLGVKQELISSYIAELIRVHGCKIKHEPRSEDYRLIGKCEVNPWKRAKA